MKLTRILIGIIAAFCTFFSVMATVIIIRFGFIGNSITLIIKSIVYIILPIIIAILFLLTAKFDNKNKYILLILGTVIIFAGIIFAPYAPCNDSLDIHNILYQILQKQDVEVFYRTYMNFWINNKLTVFCYIPFVKLFGNVTLGVRFFNAALLIGTILFTALSVKNILEVKCFEKTFLLMSAIAPYMLLSGPYIYLLSLFIGSAAIFFYSKKSYIYKILFYFCSSMLFILRPTSFGFIAAFLCLSIFLDIQHKKYVLNQIISVILIFVFAVFCKTVTGKLFEKNGIHKYPSMYNGAMLWTLELGTRSNPKVNNTGTCFYTPFNKQEDFDEIQNDFYNLWLDYYNDEFYNTSEYEKIKLEEKAISNKIYERFMNEQFIFAVDRIMEKTVNFFRNSYIPYYYKQNITNKNIMLYKDYDNKYFVYLNSIFIMFTLFVFYSFFKFLICKKNTLALTFGAAAVSVNLVLILLTEVSKKYMFDFYIPMTMCILLSLNYESKIKISLSALILSISLFIFYGYERSYEISALYGSKVSISENGENYNVTLNLKKQCREQYYIETYYREKIYLNENFKYSFSVPKDKFDAFTINFPDRRRMRISSQLLP